VIRPAVSVPVVRAVAVLFVVIFATACADDDRSVRLTGPVTAGPITVDDTAPEAGVDPCSVMSAGEIAATIDAAVEPPVRIGEMCNWDVAFAGIGATYVQIGVTTREAAAARSDGADEVLGVGDHAAFRGDDARYGATLYVLTADLGVIVATGNLLGPDDNERLTVDVAGRVVERLGQSGGTG